MRIEIILQITVPDKFKSDTKFIDNIVSRVRLALNTVPFIIIHTMRLIK